MKESVSKTLWFLADWALLILACLSSYDENIVMATFFMVVLIYLNLNRKKG